MYKLIYLEIHDAYMAEIRIYVEQSCLLLTAIGILNGLRVQNKGIFFKRKTFHFVPSKKTACRELNGFTNFP